MKRMLFLLVLSGLLLVLADARASSVLPMTLDDSFQAASGVFRGTVLEVKSYKNPADGMIYTRTLLRVDEGFKGKFPPVIKVVHRGGEVDGIGMSDDLSPRFHVGEECVLFVSRRPDGTLFASQGDASAVRLQRETRGGFVSEHRNFLEKIHAKINPAKTSGADVTDQAATVSPDGFGIAPSGDGGGSSTNGLNADGSGIPARFPLPDRGEAIPYLVDATFLPTGMTLSNALIAVSNAFSVWASASSFKFVFAGTNNFGQASANINTNDGVFRIQLHDAYNYIQSANILGKGGSYFSVGLLANANWGPGGNVNGMEFNQSQCGFVVLNHTNVVMQTLSTFTEVLTHEIGHVIGLAHSSEVVTNNATLTNSIMYYLAHADGRGASLNSYDTNVIREVHPLNTPPYSYNRVMDVTDASPQPNVAGINEVELRGYDLQSTNLTLAITNITQPHGAFSQTGIKVKFTPSVFGNGPALDPAGNSFYEYLNARVSDGTNASPYISLRVLSLSVDSFPAAVSDGIPDNWMTTYFNNSDPSTGLKRQATNDFDGDGLNNLQEYIAGMNPTNATSVQRLTFTATNTLQWQAKAYELYEVQTSTNLTSTNWTRFGNPILPITSTGSVTNPYNPALPQQFFRIQKVP